MEDCRATDESKVFGVKFLVKAGFRKNYHGVIPFLSRYFVFTAIVNNTLSGLKNLKIDHLYMFCEVIANKGAKEIFYIILIIIRARN